VPPVDTTHGITSVTVERDGDDLVVRWDGMTDGPVAVCIGAAPDAIDHQRPAAVVDGGQEARLAGVGRDVRHYVHVGPQEPHQQSDELPSGVVAAERLVPLEGTLNFRDLGGYLSDDGSRVRWGRLFRSDGLHALTDADHELLTAIGLRTVYDLRWASELEAQPSRLPAEGVVVHHLAVGEDPEGGGDLLERIFSGEIEEISIERLVDIYNELLDQGAATFAKLLTHLTDDGALPAVFHCSAGKDRTGISAALLLRLLGVPRDVVLDDYELSTTYRTAKRLDALRPRFEEAGLDIDRFRDYLSAPRPVLAATLTRIETEHGGVEGYLRDGGMDSRTPGRLRELLLEDVG
jgi:protein-tyrosine phosphatase